MAKRNRKIRENNTPTSAEVTNEEQVGTTQEVLDSMQEGMDVREEPTADPIEADSAGETSQDVPETVEEPTEDTGTEEQVTGSEVAPEGVEESGLNEQVEETSQTSEEEPKTEEQPVTTGRRAAVKDDSLLKVLFTENPQRAGTKSHGYNETLMAEGNLTVKKAMELGVPRHHLLYLKKEGKLDVVTE